MNGAVSFTRNHEIGIVTIDNAPVNAINAAIAHGIAASIEQAGRDMSMRAVVIAARGPHFSAGADLRELERVAAGRQARPTDFEALARLIEDCPKPVVCALHGACLGAGLEIAAAAHYRVAAPDALLGQPEVKVGLIPSAGGTQRLPRFVGVAPALELCWRGEAIRAEQAAALGLVDRIVSGDLLTGALVFARRVLAERGKPRRARELPVGPFDPGIFEAARRDAAKSMRGRIAPLKAIEAVEAATRLSFEEGLRREAALARECLFSDQARALIHVFFSERAAAKGPGLARTGSLPPVRQAAVVGAGTMGGGIAMAFANAGIPVIVKEVSSEALERGLAAVRANYAASVERGRLSAQAAEERLALIRGTLDYGGFESADVAIEAVFEDLELKKRVFAELDKVTRPGAILATNTSSLDVDQMAAQTSRPEKVLGLHFFSPAHVMRLLEVVRGAATAPEVIAAALDLARRLGKIPVVVANALGFAGNRMFEQYRREAQFLVEEGASPLEVDQALYDFGMAMGPLATGDLVGLDVAWRIRKLFEARAAPGTRRPLIEDKLYAMGRYGQKTGAGWYRYPSGRTPVRDPEVEKLIAETVRAAAIPQRRFSAEEIVERTIFAMVNEGARILEEGVAAKASDLDVIWVHGFGFPAWRGGPMWYASTLGWQRVYERIREFERELGAHWKPAALLGNLAATASAIRE
jgi:3-hydroxyacyl-CoA dehydrogenase